MKIIVTGASGFLGQHLLAHLKSLGHDPYPVSSKAYDLRWQSHVDALFKHTGTPDLIYHLAANVGGINYNLENPANIYYDNIQMNTYFIHKSAIAKVGKFVFVGSVCSYPKYVPIPTQECHLWTGYPEESNGAYGVSKLAALTQLQAYNQQYGLNFAYPLLANLYGPGDGGFNEASKSHVVPALIKRISEAKRSGLESVQIWGDGTPTRDLLYIEDAAKALVRFTEVDYPKPVNVATNVETSIANLAKMIAAIAGYEGKLTYDATKAGGQLRRCYDIFTAKHVLEWQPETGLRDGLKQTIEWYNQ